MPNRPVALVIIDGYGHSENRVGNAIIMAKKPNLDLLQQQYPYTFLQASGQAVGLDWGEPGNSEVGHLSIGAGRIVKQYLSIINGAINNGSFYQNPVLLQSMHGAKNAGGKLHLLGLLTSGSVHAFFKHLLAIIEMATKTSVPEVYLHIFTDGKDSGLKEAPALLAKLRDYIKDFPQVKIATMIGRNASMERNNDWAKTQIAYNLFVNGEGMPVTDLDQQLQEYYNQGITDEDIPPTVLASLPRPLITPGDSLIFFNFREDSMRQITHAFMDESFDFFPRQKPSDIHVATLTKYFDYAQENFIIPPLQVKNNLAEWLSSNGLKQLHIAESEKYAHVTLFFNGLADRGFEGESDFFLESPRDLVSAPEMRSADIADKVVNELQRGYFDFYVINFANADLIAHLGNINLVSKGIEKVDTAIGAIHQEMQKQNGILIITADHGNAESLTYSPTGERETKHNSSPVPFFLVVEEHKGKKFSGQTTGIISDIAPSILELMGITKPVEMTGRSLLSDLQ
ncbi:MAG: 2,3-bisphosphoglycerate-independent phosphoglycerate mutase [bacterium]|nr:2,3-bisphosphoglycerate-independent phosphoglycerate mutase [bacterium]